MDDTPERIRQEFAKRQGRQNAAISTALLLVIVLALLYARPRLLGPNARAAVFSAQVLVVAAFIAYTSQNWRCPVCNRHLGGDLHRSACGRCRARLR